MTYDLLTFLPQMLAGGAALVLTILAIRLADQWRRDKGRVVVSIRWPRNVGDKQVLAVVRAILGLAPATSGLSGRASVALEVVGTANGITFRLRLPAKASAYLIAQLRTAVPGLAVETVEEFKPERCRKAVELRRRISQADLAVADVAAVSQTILAALTQTAARRDLGMAARIRRRPDGSARGMDAGGQAGRAAHSQRAAADRRRRGRGRHSDRGGGRSTRSGHTSW